MTMECFLNTYLKLNVSSMNADYFQQAYLSMRATHPALYAEEKLAVLGIIFGMLLAFGDNNPGITVDRLHKTDIYSLPYDNEPGFEEAVKEWKN